MTKAVRLDCLCPHCGVGAYSRLEMLAGQDAVASNLDRGDSYNVIHAHLQPRGLAIDGNNLVRGSALEHEPVRLVPD